MLSFLFQHVAYARGTGGRLVVTVCVVNIFRSLYDKELRFFNIFQSKETESEGTRVTRGKFFPVVRMRRRYVGRNVSRCHSTREVNGRKFALVVLPPI